MRRSRPVRLAVLVIAATMISACGSTAEHTSSPSARKLSLLKRSGPSAADASLYPQRPTTYVLDGALADLGADALVRKLVGHDVTATERGRIADALGMKGTPVRTETGWELRDGDALLTFGTSNAVTSVDYSSAGGAGSSPGSVGSTGGGSTGVDVAPPVPSETLPPESTPAPVDVPNPDDAMNIAQSLLDNLGVLRGQQWFRDVAIGGGTVVGCSAGVVCEGPPPTVSARTVTFELVVDGVHVPGVSWSVTIGEHRRVESVSGAWARPIDSGTYALRSTQNVFDDLRNGQAQYVGPQPLTATGAPEIAPDTATSDTNAPPVVEVHITGVALGLARWDGTENEHAVTYLVPTYRFHARVAPISEYDIELLALDPVSFAIVEPSTADGSKPGQPGESVEPQTAPAPQPRP